MILGNGFLPMFSVAAGGGLTGATWALDGSGRAYNVPTLGSELLTNGGFDSGTVGWADITGAWAVDLGALAGTAVAANAYGPYSNNSGVVAGKFYRTTFTIVATGGTLAVRVGNDQSPGYSTGTHLRIFTAITTGVTAFQVRAGGGGFTGTIDNISVREPLMPATLATVAGSSATQTAAAKIHTLTTGTQAGVGALIDSASNPQNFLIGYHDGTNVRLDKCVGGTYTNLITTTVAFSSNAQIEIRRPSGNTFQLWYNGTQRGTDQTVADAGIISNTIYGLFSTFSGNLFTEFSLDGAVIPFGF